MATSLLELENRVRAILDEPVAAQWTQADIRRWLNDANRDLARVTHHYKGPKTITLTSGAAEYVLPEDVLAVEHAYYIDATGSRQVPLAAAHWEVMDDIWGEHRDWQGAWPQMFTVWGYAPFLKLRLYPVPSITGDTCQLLVAQLPVEMPLSGSDTTNVDVPSAWVDALVDYCAYMAHRRDRRTDLAAEALAAFNAKRDGLLHNNDYLGVNRELVADPRAGYVPAWLAGGDW